MVRTRPTIPPGHGELLTRPPYESWSSIAEETMSSLATANVDVGGVALGVLRKQARREAVAEAAAFSECLGVPLADPEPEPRMLVVTGHQPELFHPGVWAKMFLLDRFARENDAVGIDLVVDSDAFYDVGMSIPCLLPEARRCRVTLAQGDPGTCYACAPVPDVASIERFCDESAALASALPAPAVARHLVRFCEGLRRALPDASDIGQLMTVARRRFEADAGTGYLELPVTRLASTRAFSSFAMHLICHAARFRVAYNVALDHYRTVHKTRSRAQPFPDLAESHGAVELPFWVLSGKERKTLWVRVTDAGREILADDERVAHVPATPKAGVEALDGIDLAPKALALTMYTRLLLSDLFIHGVGGGRYDQVTDEVVRSFFRIEPPSFAVASLTMYLPVGAHPVSAEEVQEVRRRLGRFEHNPDTMLSEAEFDSAEEAGRATALAAQKADLLRSISSEGADKKSLGVRIREINEELGALLAPLAEETHRKLVALEAQHARSEVLTDRTYPYCLWSPEEVADKVG